MRHTRRVIGALLSITLLAPACGDDDDDEAGQEPVASAVEGDTDDAAETSPATSGSPATSVEPASADTASGGVIKIGTTLPLTGPLGAFGPLLQAGYEKAIDEVNADGGLVVGDSTHTVELVIRDNASDGNEASTQARDLILGDGVVALLGAVTPPLTIPISVAAEQNKIPVVSTTTPIRAWLGGNPEGWNYAFDLFFDETQMTDLQYQASDLVDTNKKVALFTDLEEDGIVMGGMWEDKAADFGYEIVAHPEFPVGTTNFSSQVAEAKSAGADVVIAQVIPPDAIALLKQMKADDYQPAVMFVEKGANFGAWTTATEGLGEGVMAASWFAEGEGNPREAEFIEEFTPMAGGANSDVGAIVYAYTAARVLLDAIVAAGATDADAVVEALKATDAVYPAGHVAFTDNAAAMPAIMTQWRGPDMVYVTRADGTPGPESIVAPVPGLG